MHLQIMSVTIRRMGLWLDGKSIKKVDSAKGEGKKNEKKECMCASVCLSVCAPFKLLRSERVPDGAVQSAIT